MCGVYLRVLYPGIMLGVVPGDHAGWCTRVGMYSLYVPGGIMVGIHHPGYVAPLPPWVYPVLHHTRGGYLVTAVRRRWAGEGALGSVWEYLLGESLSTSIISQRCDSYTEDDAQSCSASLGEGKRTIG